YLYNGQANTLVNIANPSKIQRSAETWMYCDGYAINSPGNMTFALAPKLASGDYIQMPAGGFAALNVWPTFWGRHRAGQGNILWWDGHVSAELPHRASDAAYLATPNVKQSAIDFLNANHMGYPLNQAVPPSVTNQATWTAWLSSSGANY